MNWRRLCLSLLLAAACALTAVPAFAAGYDSGEALVTTLYNERNGLPTGEANAVLQTGDGYIWIGSYGGLIRYDGTTFRNYSMEGLLPSSSVRSLFEDSAGRLWIGTNDAGVFVMEEDVITRVEGPREIFLCIRDFAEGADGTVYAASNSGLAEIRDGILTPYSGEHLSGETVYSVCVDRYGRLWEALNSGLCAVVESGQVKRLFSSDEFFDGEDIYCTAADEKGDVYLGSSGSVLVKLTLSSDSLDPADMEIRTIATEGVSTHNCIHTEKDGSVVVCGGTGSCVIGPDGRQTVLSETERAVAVNSGCMDYEGNIWLASTSFGIIKYTEGCFSTPNKTAGLEDLPVNALVRQGERYYLAADTGLLIFERDWSPVENELTRRYAGVRVRCLLADRQGRVWVAAYSYTDPLACYDPAAESIRVYTTEDGLISSSTRALLELSDGTVAVGTQEGLNLIRDGKVTASFGPADGLEVPSVLCLLESSRGTLLAGSDGGGIYEIDGDTVTNHGFSEGLDAGVVLRLLADADGGGYFVSAGSELYYWDGSSFRLLSNLVKGPGSIFDFYDRDGELWILQNSGVLAYDKTRLLAGEEPLRPREYSFEHGLSGSLNANTWNWMEEDGSLYLSTRNGISLFRFQTMPAQLPKGIINGVSVDGSYSVRPHELTLAADAGRVTIDFAALSYTGTTDIGIAYCLEGFDREETVLTGIKSESVSYTNLPGGEYTFLLRVFDPEDPGRSNSYELPIVKSKTMVEQPWFIPLLAFWVVIVTAGIAALIFWVKLRGVQRRQREYRSIVEQALQTFAHTIDAKDRYTNGHSIRVAAYSRELARRMGKSEEEQEQIYYIALLHDIGKIGVPDQILNKPGRLTDEEREIIQSHPAIGGDILKDFTALDGIQEGARFHHERYDGKGYCEHRAGKDIPEVARIIGVADTYDAMSSDRCYRKGLPPEVIEEELKKNSGTQFDPVVVPYMLEMMQDGTAPIKTEAAEQGPAAVSHS